jgi:hypothetical protein
MVGVKLQVPETEQANLRGVLSADEWGWPFRRWLSRKFNVNVVYVQNGV